jgi:hypothetical protein
MPAPIDLKQLTTLEKLRLMEALWQELSDGEIDSPKWHGKVLAERDRLIASGEDSFVDWEVANRQLREALQ